MGKKTQKSIKSAPHSFTRKVCHWLYCAHCGMVLLKKNEPSIQRSKTPCEG